MLLKSAFSVQQILLKTAIATDLFCGNLVIAREAA